MSVAPISVSVVTVTYNSGAFIGEFLASLYSCNLEGVALQVIVVDNGSTDDTPALVQAQIADIELIRNPENNYAGALNLGIAHAAGDFVVVVNNDGTVEAMWLQGMLDVMRDNVRAGAVQSKIVFAETGLLNSVGVEEVEHFYYRDIAFEAADSAQYRRPAKREFVTGGSVMFRRECLEQVGGWDEDFILYLEDVDYSIRCRQAGWELQFAPDSIFKHRYHGVASEALCDYFCARNRFFLVAKHFPGELASCIGTSHFFSGGQYDLLYRSLLHALVKLCLLHDQETSCRVLRDVGEVLEVQFGRECHDEFFFQLELLLGLRDLRLGVVDAPGASEQGGILASLLRERYPSADVALLQSDKLPGDVGLLDVCVDTGVALGDATRALRALSVNAGDAGGGEWLASVEHLVRDISGVDALPGANA